MTKIEVCDILFAEVVYNRFVLSGKVLDMTISYNGLWKLLIDKLDINSALIAKMWKGEGVSYHINA